MTRVIHTGDTHVGYRQYHSPERRADFLAAFEQVVDDAVAEDVDAVVHAGDLFHDRRPGLADLQGTVAALRRLADAGIPFLGVVGNHEGKRDGQWLDLFEDLGLAVRLGREPYRLGDAALYGLDYVPKSRRADLDYEFAESDAAHDLLVTHGLFEPFAHAEWDTADLLDRASVDFDALLLGDNHEPGIRTVDDTWVTYPGSTERCSATEREERGYNIVTLDDDVDITRRGLDATREFVFVDVELAPGEGVERVRARVLEHDLEDAVVIVSVDGDGEAFAPAAVEEAATEAGALIARVTDRRDVEEEREIDVNFADPDEAVRERVRDLGLSTAARDVDETVRASDVADSNVREAVKRRVEDLADDPDAFGPEDDESEEGDAEEEAGDDGSEGDSDDGDETTENAEEATDDGDADSPDDAAATAEPGDHEPGADEHGDDEQEDDDHDDAADQASMEEYL
jgi:exonuclease SbcD